MTRLRRTLVLVLTAVAVVLGLTSPAGAAYRDTATASSSVTTLTVAPPTSLSTAGTKCVTTYNAWNNTYSTRLDAQLSWKASATRGVSGYVVRAYFTDGSSTPVAMVGPTATSVKDSYDAYYATQNVRVTVTTTTSYGWTAESEKSGVIKC